ncbi:MAG: hypothetical protein HRU18_28410 [Pseudoalteromonas sp.]|uniref:hypothetical protein n=1 Tax=Pseudoalteromonas sp. TaxID=53249 RepID=UPI001D38F0D6|nr:hypothetical protein [Pseudoalteromonas sp.]NRA82135.1 hypothetical protein [Pseudoalteromonas sp.]
MMKFKSMLWFFLLCMSNLFSCSNASELRVKDGKLLLGDAVVPTELNFENYSSSSEVKPLFSSRSRGDLTVIKIVSTDGNVQFLLYDSKINQFQKIGDFPVELSVNWFRDDVFILQRKSMGTSVSILYLVKSNQEILHSGYVKQFLSLDLNNMLIFTLSNDDKKILVSNFSYTDHVEISDNLDIFKPEAINEDAISFSYSSCGLKINQSDLTEKSIELFLGQQKCELIEKLISN